MSEQVVDQQIQDVVAQEDSIQEEVVQEESQESESTQELQEEQTDVQAETEQELKDEVEQAIEDGASEEEVVSMIKQFKLKVNGKEYVKEIDVNDEESLKKELQLAAAGRNAMQEAAELKKAYQQELMRIKQNPLAVLEELGLDSLAISEERIKAEVEKMQKSPEELEREQIQKELAEARAEAEQLKKEREESESNALYEQESKKLQTEIKSALDAHGTLHATPRITRRVAETMEWAMENGFDDVTADDVLPTVEAQLTKELNEMFTDFDEKAIERFIGKGNMDKLRKKRVSDIEKKPSSIADLKQETAKVTPKEEKATKKRRLDDFMRRR